MILLVEDNELIQQLVTDVCRNVGLACFCATRCRVALAAITHYDNVRLVLMDYKLAGPTSGIACAVAIRQLPPPKCDIPIIGLTGGLYPGIDPHLVDAARIDEQLDKPFRLDELVALIDKYVPLESRALFGIDLSDGIGPNMTISVPSPDVGRT